MLRNRCNCPGVGGACNGLDRPDGPDGVATMSKWPGGVDLDNPSAGRTCACRQRAPTVEMSEVWGKGDLERSGQVRGDLRGVG